MATSKSIIEYDRPMIVFIKTDMFHKSYGLTYAGPKQDPELDIVQLLHYDDASVDSAKNLHPHIIKAILLLKPQPQVLQDLQKVLDLEFDLAQTVFMIVQKFAMKNRLMGKNVFDRRDVEIMQRSAFIAFLEAAPKEHARIIDYLISRNESPSPNLPSFEFTDELDECMKRVENETLAKQKEEDIRALIEMTELERTTAVRGSTSRRAIQNRAAEAEAEETSVAVNPEGLKASPSSHTKHNVSKAGAVRPRQSSTDRFNQSERTAP